MIPSKTREFFVKSPHIEGLIHNYCPKRNSQKKFLFLSLLIVSLILTLKLVSLEESIKVLKIAARKINHYLSNEGEPGASFLRYDVACPISKLDPFHTYILHLVEEETERIDCEDKSPLLFKSTFSSTLVPLKILKEMEQVGVHKCCYKIVHRAGSDNTDRLSNECYPVSLVSSTEVPQQHEFIAISCELKFKNTTIGNNGTVTKIVDVHAFVHMKPNVEERIQNIAKAERVDTRMNVVLFGIDAVSHMSFLRTMPKSYSFLMNELNAVEMHGYHKIGYNTLPNMVAFLAAQSADLYDANLGCKEQHTFDKCPFIWKNFSKHGFRTSFGEDAAWLGTFNYGQKGFIQPPTDYYLRPFTTAANTYIRLPNQEKEYSLETDFCYAPRLSFEVLLNYIQKFAYTMGSDRPYFQIIWSSALTHDFPNYGRLGDKHLRSTLEWFHNGGYLNHTIFILLSDHGTRTGDILDYQQGQLESRMPFLYFVMPPWFKKKYEGAYKNLLKNQDRLTTPWDFHETLKDLLTLEDITTNVIKYREMNLGFHEYNSSLPRGISQFLPIPLSRTCKQAGIENYYCVCRNLTDISTNTPAVRQAAYYAVHFMNSIICKEQKCAILSLSKIKSSKAAVRPSGDEDYQIVFETFPGDASFEAAILRDKDGNWSVSGTIDRTNSYGEQSHCVETRLGKLYCYCID